MATRDEGTRSKPRLARPRAAARRHDVRRRSDRLPAGLDPQAQALLDAATAILSTLSLEAALRTAADETRRLVGAQAVLVTHAIDPTRTAHVLSVADAYAAWLDKPDHADRAAFAALAGRLPLPARCSVSELDAHPAWRELRPRGSGGSGARAAVRGVAAVSLVGRAGHEAGSLQATAKVGGEFDDTDLAVVGFLGRVAAIAAETAHHYEEAQASSRLKDEFLTTLSHELRTPLNAIVGWAHLLRTGALKGEETTRAIETIDRNAKVQTQLISDVLDVSRIVSGRLRLNVSPIRPSFVIDEAVESLRAAAEARRIKLRTVIDPSAGPVLADPDRLRQIVWNLLSNAIKFTPEKGRVTVSLARTGAEVTLEVRDTGKGIAPALLPYIFERFRQSETMVATSLGLGLGLSIVRHLVEAHGGRIRAESPGDGLGATFTVTLPVHTDVEASTPAPAIGDEPRMEGLAILVVEDDPDARQWLVQTLEGWGAHVSTASSGREALDAVTRQRLDVLVSDIRLPDTDGYELIRKIRDVEGALGRYTPAVALTAYPRVEDRARALEAGYQMHVPKPVAPRDLASVIATLTNRPVDA